MKQRIIFILLLFSISGYFYGQNTMDTAHDFGLMRDGYGHTSTLNTTAYTNNYGTLPTNDVFYRFQITEPQVVTIYHCGSQVSDTYVYLLDPLGYCLYESGNGNTNICSNAGLAYLKVNYLPPGAYYVVSKGKTANGYITTTIEVSSLAKRDPIDVGIKSGSFTYKDTQNTTQFGNTYVGQNTNDVTYKFTLTRAMTVTLSHYGSPLTNTCLYLLNASKGLIASDQNASSSTSYSYLKKDLPAGTYYVISEGYSQNGNITTSIEGAPSTVVDIGTKSDVFTYSHTQNTDECADSYQGRSTKDVTYKLTLTVPMHLVISHCGSAVADTYLSLLDASKTLIAFNNDYTGEGACTNTQHAYLSKNLSAGTYYIVSEGYTQNGNITTSIQATRPYDKLAANPDKNYILTLKPTVASQSVTNLTIDQCMQQLQYFDGLGRPVQTIQRGVTRNKSDLVYYQEYDVYGRESRSWLPIVALSNNQGGFVNPSTLLYNASMTYSNEMKPYSLPVYEASPLNRVSEQYGPGQEWYTNNRSVKTSYMYNLAGNDTLNCIHYTVTDVANDSAVVINKVGNHPSSQLYVTRVEDEDGCTAFEFKDKTGQVILTRQVIRNGTSKELYDTYYIYDELGLKRAVSPPLLSDTLNILGTTGSWSSKTNETIKRYAYLYKYDKRKRCIAKKLPGSSWVYYVYDYADRLIFSQDGEQRLKEEWLFTIPDVFGRPCLIGTCKNSYNALAATPPLSAVMKTERENTNVVYKGYANPTVALITPKLLTVNFYDDYSFLNKNAITEFNNKGFEFAQEAGFGAQGSSAKSLPTGTLTAQLDNATTTVYHGTVMYYDDIKQMIQCISGNHLGGKDKEHIAYNFTGQPTNRKHVHVGNTTRTEYYVYTYDHAGRLKKTTHRVEGTGITNPVTVTLAENTYDDLGRLASSKANDNANLDRTYQYNVRSWIKEIGNTHFLEKLAYNYNGNIATQEWEQANNTRKYTFAYDGLSRLKTAVFTGGGSYGTSYIYDKHGNITYLTRYGNTGTSTYGMVDNLTLKYNGNRLTSVTDTGVIPSLSSSADFRKISTAAGTAYFYDTNGNLKSDPNKGITNIQYNVLNLPMSFSINNTLGQAANTYVYTADGNKLRVSKGSFTTDYVGNMIYENNSLKRILVENGYYENGMYYFYVKDHLGNNRIVANQSGSVIQSTQYYPFGMAFADGLEPGKQPYKYNDKELDSDRGLNLYDYLARQMDPALLRFTTMDPHAESYYSWSPYHYAGNNPIRVADPTGMDWYINDAGNYFWQEGSKKVEGYYNVGSNFSIQEEDGVFMNYYQNAGIRGKKAANAFDIIYRSKKLQIDLLGGNSVLSKESQSALFNGLNGRDIDAFARPIGKAVVVHGAVALGAAIIGEAIVIWGATSTKMATEAVKGGRAFFSGAGTEARAIEQGYQTLGQTRAGMNLQNLIESKNIPWSEAEPMWQRLSATWAKGVPNGSSVPVFLNSPRAGSVWYQTELPILQSKGVKLIFK